MSNDITRRAFLSTAGKTVLAANLVGFAKGGMAQLKVPDPPGRKLGWAIVGLGSLSINQILPAFAKCEKSRVVAFVSGHPDTSAQARRLATALESAAIPVRLYGGRETTHSKLNNDIGLPDDPGTKALIEFVDGVLK